MSKILIEVSGGNIQRIISSLCLDVVVIDHDNIDAGDEPVVETAPDQVMLEGTFYGAFIDEGDSRTMEIHDELKRRHI
jgi:hypothetical protein